MGGGRFVVGEEAERRFVNGAELFALHDHTLVGVHNAAVVVVDNTSASALVAGAVVDVEAEQNLISQLQVPIPTLRRYFRSPHQNQNPK